jgi:hypothetical protein
MRRDLFAMLEYEAKRRPDLARLVETIDHLTEAAIKAAPVPLPWMRQGLLALKRRQFASALAAELEHHIVNGQVTDPIGEMRRWEGSDTYIKVGRSSLEIQFGQLVWFDASGVWIDTIHAEIIDPLLRQETVGCGRVTRTTYMEAVRARARQLCPDLTIATPMERVRFYRPG